MLRAFLAVEARLTAIPGMNEVNQQQPQNETAAAERPATQWTSFYREKKRGPTREKRTAHRVMSLLKA